MFSKLIKLIFLFIFIPNITIAAGPTLVAGNISGTWIIDESPYVLTDNSTVPTGEILTIEPGVTVIIGENLQLRINGQIVASGTPDNRIIFTSPNETIKWNEIYIYGHDVNDYPSSEIKYCNFLNAQTALSLYVGGQKINDYTTMEITISNCVFDSSVDTAVYIEAEGLDASQYLTPRRRHARINPNIDQCVFSGNYKGVELFIHGICPAYCSSAQANPIIRNCFFINLTDSAFKIVQGGYSSGSPVLINNDIINCNIGFFVPDSFDAEIKNNIFSGNTTAIEKTGSVSTSAYYNSFYNNVNNFVGYPATYGDIVTINSNGTPCDIGMNIFSEPLLVNNNNIFKLTSTSPCIDAGTSDSAPDIDFEYDSRPQANGIDIGADEFTNNAPSANAGPDQVVFDSVNLDGSLSYDSDLDATLSYMWHLEHRTNSNYNQDTIGIKPNIQNLKSGFYDVVLTVEDDNEAKDTDTMILGVAGTWDINNDKKLGLEECIYILQILSGNR